jgi:hypothetical protein
MVNDAASVLRFAYRITTRMRKEAYPFCTGSMLWRIKWWNERFLRWTITITHGSSKSECAHSHIFVSADKDYKVVTVLRQRGMY